MLGDFSCRVILNVIGYVWPAYSCYKALSQKNSDAVQQWCIYWLMLALFTVSERMLLDLLVFWVPMYYEAKVLFVLYLWHPKTQGAVYLFNSIVQPFLAQNEAAIDQAVEEVKTTVVDHASSGFHRLIQYVQTNAHLAAIQLHHLQAKAQFNGQHSVKEAGKST
ncbi:HVA22-like protein i [Coccomyxa sp. Obi]|nr:HVA22-like protein i [Coccomyxa sp. Obi]